MLRECEREIRFRILARVSRVSRGGFNNHRPWKAVREEQANVKLQNTNQKDELRRRRRRRRIYYCLIVVLCLHDMAQQRVGTRRQAGRRLSFRRAVQLSTQLNCNCGYTYTIRPCGGRANEQASGRLDDPSLWVAPFSLSFFFCLNI